MKFIVTTGLTAARETVAQAISVAMELSATYVERHGTGIDALLAKSGAEYAVVVQANRLMMHDGQVEYFYHPNMLLVRGLNVIRGWRDLYIDAASFAPGESVLDCTLGFGCEASLAALSVGETGRVVGLESEPALALLGRVGMKDFVIHTHAIKAAMERVEVVCADYAEYVAGLAPGAFDVIYFDPFFGERLSGSEHSISPLVRFGNPLPLNVDAVLCARAIAGRRVIVKHPKQVELPNVLTEFRSDIVLGRKAQTAYSIFDTR